MSKASGDSRPTNWQLRFSLASVLLGMSVLSMCLALARVHLGTGLLVSFLTVPALIRTALVAAREARKERPLSALGKVLEFLFSWVLMLPIGLASIVLGGVVLTLVLAATFTLRELFIAGFGSWVPPQLEFVLAAAYVFFSAMFPISVGCLFLAWGIHSSLAYRPVAKI